MHTLGSYFDSAGNVADRVLALSAEALQERSKSAEERSGGEVSMRNVLRGLSRVIDR